MGNVFEGLKRTDTGIPLRAVMFIPRKNAESVLQDSTVAVDVQRTLIISMVIFIIPMTLDCALQKKRVECAIMIKAAEAEI